jgi:hypothetical protein
MEWQPISTAPTDQTVVLAWDAEAGMFFAFFDAGDWLTMEGSHLGLGRDNRITPTHWMPLPKRPRRCASPRRRGRRSG